MKMKSYGAQVRAHFMASSPWLSPMNTETSNPSAWRSSWVLRRPSSLADGPSLPVQSMARMIAPGQQAGAMDVLQEPNHLAGRLLAVVMKVHLASGGKGAGPAVDGFNRLDRASPASL